MPGSGKVPRMEQGGSSSSASQSESTESAPREDVLDEREVALTAREEVVALREEVVALREAGVLANEQLTRLSNQRERLLARLRAANQNLVFSGLRADELAAEAAAHAARLTLSEQRFRALVDATALIVWQATPEGAIRIVSTSSWTEITGLDASANWLDAVPEDEREAVERSWTEARLKGAEWTAEHRLRRRDGRISWVQSRGTPVSEPGAPPHEWIGMLVDMTDRHRVEEAREQFVSILGHDLRSPLSAVLLSSSRLVADPKLGPVQRRAAERISVSARRMERMVHDILDFARGRLGGGIAVNVSEQDLGGITTRALEELRLAHPTRTLKLDLEGELRGRWDAERMEQVLSNLVGNAVTHGEDPIRVRLIGSGGEVRLEVHNAGLPIPPDVLPRLFEPFRSGSRKGPGLGLGLYIVAEVVHAHGGTVEVTSEEGDTCFTARLPRER